MTFKYYFKKTLATSESIMESPDTWQWFLSLISTGGKHGLLYILICDTVQGFESDLKSDGKSFSFKPDDTWQMLA